MKKPRQYKFEISSRRPFVLDEGMRFIVVLPAESRRHATRRFNRYFAASFHLCSSCLCIPAVKKP